MGFQCVYIVVVIMITIGWFLLHNITSFVFSGSLHFANVKASDYRNGNRYACVAQNEIVRELMQGAYARVIPRGRTYGQRS